MAPSVTASRRGSLWGTLGFRALLLGGAFFLLGLLSGRFVFPGHPSAVLWLPGGLSLAFLLRSKPRDWPALLAAVFLAEFTSVLLHGIGTPVATAALWGVGNCLRTLVGAGLIRRFVGTSVRLSRSWEVLGLLLFGGLVSPVASATLGVLGTLVWTGPSSLMSHWVPWWLSDGLGTLLVAPLLLTWTPAAFHPRRIRRLVEFALTLAVTALGAHFIFGCPEPVGIQVSLAYVSFPFVLWGALRLGPLGAASTSAVAATLALWHTAHERGPFGALAAPQQQEEFSLQLFLAVLGLTALMLAAVASERRRAEQLQQLLVEAGTVLAASLDIRETLPRVARLMVPRACAGFAVWLEGENGLLERVAQAGWGVDREARVHGQVPPLPTASRRWSTEEGTVVLAPLRVLGRVHGTLVLMKDERAQYEGTADLTLAEDLAHQCGMALESARLFTKAQEAIEARNEFIAIAAHELRTPLTALNLRMRSLDALLHRERASKEAREKVHAASRQLGRLAQLVERLLDVGRITTGRLELHREPVDVNELVEQVVESFAEEASRAGSALRIKADARLTAWWDRGRVEQALANLLANALKFGMGHPIQVLISQQGSWVRIAVEDQGIGIAPEALERIFERFERAVSSRRYGGLGLGLFLTRRIAESHGGTIHVESTPGKGATFVMQLPMGQQPEAEQEAAHSPS
jgi:signal transduction histidine kinase